ncbi:hypothetical protein LBKG_01690 [Lactobacillus crispatus CTV-05]|nr:hypothetical protein LBKG_01690 [Lactobacillus crispatus CTV-05]
MKTALTRTYPKSSFSTLFGSCHAQYLR